MIGAILLHWQNTADVHTMVQALEHGALIHIVVVDQSGDFPNYTSDRVTVLHPSHNLGYGGGCNLGAAFVIEQGWPYVLLLNVDVCLTPEVIIQLSSYLEEHRSCQAVAPLLREHRDGLWWVSAGGQDPLRLGPTRIWVEEELYPEKSSAEMVYLPGTVLMMRSATFERFGYLDEDYFFGGEVADYFISHFSATDFHLVQDVLVKHERDEDRAAGHPDKVYYTLRNRYRLIDKFGGHQRDDLRSAWTKKLMRQWLGALVRGKFVRMAAIRHAMRDGRSRRFGPRRILATA